MLLYTVELMECLEMLFPRNSYNYKMLSIIKASIIFKIEFFYKLFKNVYNKLYFFQYSSDHF